jgi:predicted O-methyltransferase YrrM
VLRDIEEHLGRVTEIIDEPSLKEVEEDTRRLLEDIRGGDPFSPRWAADSRFARLGYLLCRLISPSVVLETGVAYGVSSVFILKALEVNDRGILHSVDLPPLMRGSGASPYQKRSKTAGGCTGGPAPGFCPGSSRRSAR